MIQDIRMPQLGESVTEGTIVKWLKQPGDEIALYEPICEVTTDKVNAEVPSTMEGKITELLVSEGETVGVGELICRIETAAEETSNEKEGGRETIATKKKKSSETSSLKKRYSPAVLRLAEEHNIDLTQLTGSGRGGRITRKDVLRAIEQGIPVTGEQEKEAPAATAPEKQESAKTPVVPPASITKEEKKLAPLSKHAALEQGDIEIPVTPIRRAIASNMVTSKQEIPHAWMMVEADVTGLVALRNKKKEEFRNREGISLTYMPFFLEATIEALKAYPQVNAVWNGDTIVQKKRINLSIAVATEDALFVPVIHDADEKNILGLQREVVRLAEKARTGKLELTDIQGGTFTVNNTGAFGSIASQPIINHPQAAILSFELIQKKPIFHDNGTIAVRDSINLCFSLDHRILDGWIAGQFLKRVKEKLESYTPDQNIGL